MHCCNQVVRTNAARLHSRLALGSFVFINVKESVSVVVYVFLNAENEVYLITHLSIVCGFFVTYFIELAMKH